MQRLRPPTDFASMFALVADLLSGHVIAGRYSLERLVRHDPLGALYEAIDLEQRAPVMVRVLPTLLPPGERDATAPSHHPHAAEILAVGVTDHGLPYAVIEPLSGESIFDRARRGRAISRTDAVDWSLAVAEALADAHDRGEAHGHLCPASLFLHRADTPGQRLKVLGFEINQLVPRAGSPATAASDVLDFALVLGVLFPRGLPAELASLAGRALAPDPNARPSARSFADTLGGLKSRRV